MNEKTTRLQKKLGTKLEAIDAKMWQIAKKCANQDPEATVEDMYQYLLLALIERQKSDPEFFEQTESYVVKYAYFMGTNLARKSRIYLRIVDDAGNVIDPDSNDEDEDTQVELENREKLLQKINLVEQDVLRIELVEAIAEAMETLSDDNRKVVEMLYLGYRKSEIAEELNISKPAVTYRIETIAKTLRKSINLE